MDERRFRAVLDETAKTIHSYGEPEIFAALGVIAERFGWVLSKRDPGPDCEYCDHYERHGIMVPLHACPHDAPDEWEIRETFGGADTALVRRAFGLQREWT